MHPSLPPPADRAVTPAAASRTLPPARFAQAILLNPGPAIRALNRSTLPAGQRLALLAEALLRLGRTEPAITAAIQAVTVVGAQRPMPATDLLAASTVCTDIAVWVGDLGAARACTTLEQLALDWDDHPRRFLAVALRAVALYQHTSCRTGLALLDRLTGFYQARNSSDPIGQTLTSTVRLMTDICASSHRPPAPLRADPVPGGLLHPDITHPNAGYLQSRLLRHPGRHTCQ
ncbi:hypothetical protein ACWT_5791 [Actinoplanes sp. SE50]|uniref:hypothetical protein n=1 Tax=unclassified Actinoplanes TaxID=2626549 RepID=UPI00023ED694|nr:MULTISPECIES: hypothetical protein [unclassified Actinoplanes]AEV86809.1 hypothetical protein ACPL_5922 [Actinoplanes sp. SE50/110]ATO85206.1 hypothetical protein ACWT_5791 [Actinoplanes sp. SE50]SLM02616.1 hypothetical protein ACSP50_5898 [Actinoplanes sp. SE50/110]